MTESTLQPVAVQAVQDGKPLVAVVCTLSNDAGSWEVNPPATAMVKKSASPLTVECKRQGSAGREVLAPRHNSTVWGNLLAGGGLGYLLDAKTGAAFQYPESVVVTMKSTAPDTMRPKPWTRFPPLVTAPAK